MPNSFSETLTLTCSACDQDFDAEFWLIVDTAQRPDLVERIRDGTIHDLTCPYCGDLGHWDAPLMLYRPDAEPAILFSPAEETTPEEDQQQALWLVTLLQFSMGDTWPDDRPIRDLPLVQREMLPTILNHSSEEMGTDPFATAQALINQALSGQEITLSPDQLTTELIAVMDNLATQEDNQRADMARQMALELRQALADARTNSRPDVPPMFRADIQEAQDAEQRHRRTSDQSAIDTAVAAWLRILEHSGFPSSDERFQLAVMNEAGNAFLRRYWVGGRLADLDQALRLWQRAVEVMPPNSPDLPMCLSNLGTGLRARYAHTGRLEDLEGAVDATQRAVQRTLADSPALPSILNNLGNNLTARYAQIGRLEDLEGAIEVYRRALQQTPADSPDMPSVLNNLGTSLRYRYACTGRLEDLEEATKTFQRALKQTPADSPEVPSFLDNLGTSLSDRYTQTGRMEDLEGAIDAAQRAVLRTPADSPDLAGSLNNLGTNLLARYARTGWMEDLEGAIEVYRRALQQTPADSPDMPSVLNNLGTSLRYRYTRTGRIEDLEKAINAIQRAVQRMPADSPNAPVYHSNLGSAMRALYAYTDRLEHLDEAIRSCQTAVDDTSTDRPDFPSHLNNLGNGLRDRYVRTGRLEDLDEVIRSYQTVVEHTPADAPVLPSRLNNLGNALLDRYACLGKLEDLEGAQAAYQRACEIGQLVQMEAVVTSSRSWGNWALDRREWQEAIEAYAFGRQAIDLLFATQTSRAAKESWLKEAQGLPANAAYALARLSKLTDAVEALEAGRARLLAEVLEQNRRDLERLPELGHGELLERYHQATGRIQFLQQQAGQRAEQREQQPGSSSLIEEMEQARIELNAAIAAIRQVRVDGQRPYADFLLPPTFAKIRQAAAPGAPLVYLLTTPAGSLALVVDDGQVEPLWLDGLSESQLREALVGPADDPALGGYLGAYDRWSRQSSDQAARRAWFEALDATAHWLWDVLVGPLVDHLETKGIQQAAVIAGGSLGLLPLHTAWTHDPAAPTGRRYALDTLTMAYAPSASALAAARDVAARVAPDAVLAVDNPDGSLLFSGQEVEAVLSYFADGKRKPLKGRAATRQAALREIPTYPVLHFSTHGWAGWSEPLEGGLLMASKPHLTLADLLDLRLDGARLAVLSACETGIPGTKLPDEVVSLPTGLVQAGVAGVVASLWSVNDLSTAMLMERFYRLWKQDGLAPGEALRQAQIWLRDSTNRKKAEYFKRDVPALAGFRMPAQVAADLYVDRMLSQNPDARDFAHPFYWAAFTFTGA